MMSAILHLVVAASAFVLSHLILAHPPLRSRLIARFGAGPYRGIYALVALGALVWTCFAYADAPDIRLWETGPLPLAIGTIGGPLALFLIVASIKTPSPTAGQAASITGDFPVLGVGRITRNPQLWGIALWAATHLIATGTLAATILFGALTLLAVVGSYHLDARMAAAEGERWARFAAQTSNTPFAALLAGRTRWVKGEVKSSAVVAALLIALVLLVAHPLLFQGSAALIAGAPGP